MIQLRNDKKNGIVHLEINQVTLAGEIKYISRPSASSKVPSCSFSVSIAGRSGGRRITSKVPCRAFYDAAERCAKANVGDTCVIEGRLAVSLKTNQYNKTVSEIFVLVDGIAFADIRTGGETNKGGSDVVGPMEQPKR